MWHCVHNKSPHVKSSYAIERFLGFHKRRTKQNATRYFVMLLAPCYFMQTTLITERFVTSESLMKAIYFFVKTNLIGWDSPRKTYLSSRYIKCDEEFWVKLQISAHTSRRASQMNVSRRNRNL